jgi:hypothetical protein
MSQTTSSLNESGKYSDDDGEQLSVRTTSRRVLPYEIGSRVVPSVDVSDLSVPELQALLIRMTNEPKIEKVFLSGVDVDRIFVCVCVVCFFFSRLCG